MSPRRGRGGRRQGIKGRDYKNRSDLAFNARAPTQANIPPSATYGAGVQQADVVRSARAAQQARAVPQPNPVMQAAEAFVPPQLGALDRPTERPNEPFAAGLPIGAGPGPEVLPFGGPTPDTLGQLRALFLANPTDELRDIIEDLEVYGEPNF